MLFPELQDFLVKLARIVQYCTRRCSFHFLWQLSFINPGMTQSRFRVPIVQHEMSLWKTSIIKLPGQNVEWGTTLLFYRPDFFSTLANRQVFFLRVKKCRPRLGRHWLWRLMQKITARRSASTSTTALPGAFQPRRWGDAVYRAHPPARRNRRRQGAVE